MLTRTIHFEPVRLRQTIGYKCTDCGKSRTKVVCVEHTVNPFNKNADGIPKTREEVWGDVRKEHSKQVAKTKAGVRCNKCKDARHAEQVRDMADNA